MARVLIIEDHDGCRESLVALLEIWGHQVAAAAAGPAGLAIAPVFKPDVVLLDLGLPQMDGYEVARRLQETIDPIPFLIALTGFGHPVDYSRAIDSGFDSFFLKPVDLDTLKLQLEAPASKHVRRGERHPERGKQSK